MVLADLLFPLAPRPVFAEHFDDELRRLFQESGDLRILRNELIRDESHIGAAHRVGSSPDDEADLSREDVAQAMYLVVHLEEEESPSGHLAVTKPTRRHPDNFSPHELAGAKHAGDASKLFGPKQCCRSHDTIIASTDASVRREAR